MNNKRIDMFGLVWLIGGLLLAGGLIANAIPREPVESAVQHTKDDQPGVAFTPIEQIQVGQRVVTGMSNLGQVDPSSTRPIDQSSFDVNRHRLIRMRAEWTWTDGTLDDVNVESIQSLEWITQHALRIGNEAPLPLDAVEMGLPSDLRAKVLDIQPCPPIATGPGRVVLTTVNHLNPHVLELSVVSSGGEESTIRPTAFHKFFSSTHNEWVSAIDLQVGDELQGLAGPCHVQQISRVPGTHRVFNLTVHGEHVYRVANSGVLVHNNGCKLPKRTTFPNTADEMSDFLGMPGTKIPDGPATPGRNKTVWKPNKDTKITHEAHPYHPNAPDWHKNPHWHLDTPGKPHERYLPGDGIPGLDKGSN